MQKLVCLWHLNLLVVVLLWISRVTHHKIIGSILWALHLCWWVVWEKSLTWVLRILTCERSKLLLGLSGLLEKVEEIYLLLLLLATYLWRLGIIACRWVEVKAEGRGLGILNLISILWRLIRSGKIDKIINCLIRLNFWWFLNFYLLNWTLLISFN